MTQRHPVHLNTSTKFILSTSGSESSIAKHNTMLQSFNVNIVYFTFSRKVSPEGYANLLRAPVIQGGAVTGQGLKDGIVPFLDHVDEYAAQLGAVNTVINRDGRLHGYNTDAFGFETAIRNHKESSGFELMSAVIYGNGGVSGVAYRVLSNLGMKVTLRGRDAEKVSLKRAELGITDFSGPYDLVVNATPASSAPIAEATGLEALLIGSKMVFDHSMPEKDGRTNYLRDTCKKSGVYFIPGHDMYLPQMIQQWSLFLEGEVNLTSLKDYCLKA